jgi:carotenoid cleavage dioxygenase
MPRLTNTDPIDFETDVASLPIAGRLPEGLEGTLLRIGPNPVIPEPSRHWFSGDGMLHAFQVGAGRVRYRNRWVRTTRWQAAQRVVKGLPSVETPPELDSGVANTHVILHAGRTLALEEAHRPVAVQLDTLETLGIEDFDGRVGLRFTAHPKTDPETGELVFFGYGSPDQLSAGMTYGVVSRDGSQVRHLEYFDAPYAAMVHDFAVTCRHVVFPVMPLTASLARVQSGRPAFAWEPEFGTRVGLMRREGHATEIEWWKGPACYAFHFMNAWEDGRHLFVDAMQYDAPPLFPQPDGSPPTGPFEARLTRWHFDLDDPRREFVPTVLEEIPGDFPRIDDRRAMLPYRHGWYAGSAVDAEGGQRLQARLVHVDHAAPRADVYTCDALDHLSEPVFVPRHADAREGDGWIVATAFRGATRTSDFVVFDAQNVAAGPICAASLSHRVPDGFHGNWFPAGASARAPT